MFNLMVGARRRIFMVVMAMLVLAGCGTMGSIGESPVVRIAVQVAVYKYTGGDPDRAARVLAVANDALQILEGDASTTVMGLKATVVERVLSDLTADPVMRITALTVIDSIALELANRVGDGELDGEKTIRVRTVLNWIRDYALMTMATGETV